MSGLSTEGFAAAGREAQPAAAERRSGADSWAGEDLSFTARSGQADGADLVLGDTFQTQRLGELVDGSGGDAVDVGKLEGLKT